MNRAKPLLWMVANVVWLVAAGALSYFMQNMFCVIGVVAAATAVGVAFFGKKLPVKGNLGLYFKMVLSNLFFWPVEVFEEIYAYLPSKL